MGGLLVGTRRALLGKQSYIDKVLSYNPTAYWIMNEKSGPVCNSIAGNAITTENLIGNAGFEYGATTHVFGGWLDRVGTGAIASEAVIIHGGSAACKLTRGTDNNTWVYQDFVVVPDDTLSLSFWARGDGTVGGRYAVWDTTNSAWITAFTATGVTAAAYAEVTDTIVVPATCGIVKLYFAVPTAAGSCYFDDVTVTGETSLNGSYSGAGITFGQPGIGDGNTSVNFNGVTTSVLVGSNRLDAVWNGDKGSAIAWGNIAAGDWTDVAEFRYLFHMKSINDSSVYLAFGKHNVAHQIFWRRKLGVAVSDNEQTYTFAPSGPTSFFCMGYVWDVSVPRLRGYVYAPGVLPFTEVFNVAGADMNAWGDHPVSNGLDALLMAGSPSAQEFEGDSAHIAYWAGQALTAGQMQNVMML